jgi:hypothetical protein
VPIDQCRAPQCLIRIALHILQSAREHGGVGECDHSPLAADEKPVQPPGDEGVQRLVIEGSGAKGTRYLL